MNDITLQPQSDGSVAPQPGSGPGITAEASPPSPRRLPRLWPGVLIAAIMLLLITVPAQINPTSMLSFQLMLFAPMGAALALTLWWLFASRLRWWDKVLGIVAFVVATVLTILLAHPSVSGYGAMPLVLFGLPAALVAVPGWLLVSFFLPWSVRRIGLVVVLFLVGGYFDLIRFDGVDGSMQAEINWRWSPTPEQKFLAELEGRPSARQVKADALKAAEGNWAGFRGPGRDSRLPGVTIATDWEKAPPKLLWKQRIGPGWSSFAVVGKSLYTQEQRGDEEVVVCYDADTGRERWNHTEQTRFYEAVAGAGPRATPTYHDGRIYAQGANGLLTCLNAATGKRIWQRNIAEDSGARVPQWGFAASPLVAHGLVTVYAGGEGKGVVAYHVDDGKLAWAAGTGAHSYCSTQLSTIDGVEQLLVTHGDGLTSLHPQTGKVLWEHQWKMEGGMARVTQPAVINSQDVLMGTFFGMGTRRVRVTQTEDGWKTEEVWTTRDIKPYYNDLVVHKGHLYGYDGMFFVCVDLKDGQRKWRARGYGNGQVLLLPDQDLLVVLTEKGAVALVKATPEGHTRVAKVEAISGKTWNHPVIANGRLYVRNGEEMACLELPE